MAKYNGTVVLSGMISPTDTRDIYPTHEDTLGKGGYRSVNTLVEMNGIPDGRKKNGMLCYVSETDKTYILKNSSWEEVNSKLNIKSIDNSTSFNNIDTLKIDTNTGLNFNNDSEGSITIAAQKAFTQISDGNNDLFSYDSQTINLDESLTIKPSITGNNVKFQTKAYSYSSSTPSVTHTISHNLGTNKLICNIYVKNNDGSLDFVVVPYTIKDLNTIEVNLTVAKNIAINVIPLESL